MPDEKKPQPLDLETLDVAAAAERGASMTLLHPVTGAATDIKMTVLGGDAPAYRANLRKIRDTAAERPEGEPTEQDAVAVLAHARNAAAAVTGWSNVVYGGKPVTFSLEGAVDLMRRRPWVADQVAMFRDRRANFFRD